MGYELLTPRPPRRRLLTPRNIVLVLAALALSLLLLFSVAPCTMPGSTSCYRGFFSPHSFDADLALHPRWMEPIPDAAPLTSLSIPGTHDTMTYRVDVLPSPERLQCQNLNLSTQLGAGMRYFDIRARLEDDALRIYHADGFTGFDLEDVLLDMFAFLDENPSEALVVRLKEEGKPLGDSNTISFEESFNEYLHTRPATAPGAAKHMLPLYDPSTKAPIPTLGALRGKIFLLQNFKPDSDGDSDPSAPPVYRYGLEWEGPQMALEDYWIIPDVYHLADKWVAVRTALERAASAAPDDGLLYLAHVSASVGVLPIEAAAGPLNRTVAGMNDVTGQWARDYVGAEGATRTGVVIVDFPGRRLVEAILAWNDKLIVR
ncbi:hypothetical protein N3K66_008982 [Trichothecium roseum]|uniref:Uncharacterized protein n=1 Tax=Trichothecium roseum TaxID=47278 RepID=A0ACC0URD6_9HYPO|nr:hypothetical protein N3K66_008982 [Trichothecium roseum]